MVRQLELCQKKWECAWEDMGQIKANSCYTVFFIIMYLIHKFQQTLEYIRIAIYKYVQITKNGNLKDYIII